MFWFSWPKNVVGISTTSHQIHEHFVYVLLWNKMNDLYVRGFIVSPVFVILKKTFSKVQQNTCINLKCDCFDLKQAHFRWKFQYWIKNSVRIKAKIKRKNSVSADKESRKFKNKIRSDPKRDSNKSALEMNSRCEYFVV